jgi:large-conductance mechanosensitive channel
MGDFLMFRHYFYHKIESDKAQPQSGPSKQEALLEEIRDLLREQK